MARSARMRNIIAARNAVPPSIPIPTARTFLSINDGSQRRRGVFVLLAAVTALLSVGNSHFDPTDVSPVRVQPPRGEKAPIDWAQRVAALNDRRFKVFSCHFKFDSFFNLHVYKNIPARHVIA
jgi:hypothetical protein